MSARMRFGRLEAFNSINIVLCGQRKANYFLKQEQRTWRAERENFGPLPFEMPVDYTGIFFIPMNRIVTLTTVAFFKESTSNISSNISEIQLEVYT